MEEYYRYKIEKTVEVSKIVTVHYFELTKDFDYPAESHDFWELHYVDKGHVFCFVNGQKQELRQGEVIFYRPGTEHRVAADGREAANLCILSFECPMKAALPLPESARRLKPAERELISSIYKEAAATFSIGGLTPSLKKLPLRQNPPLGSMQLIGNYLEQLLLQILRRDGKREEAVPLQAEFEDPNMAAVADYLRQHLGERLSLDALSARIGYGKTFLCTRFKKASGRTISHYFSELKITEAKRLLREEKNMSIALISDKLSFGDPAYFCSVFKKITGISPRDYARSIHAFDR